MRKTFNWAVLLALLAILAWVGIDAGSGRSGSAMLADNVMPAVADSDPSRLSNSGSSPLDPDFVEARNGNISAGAFSAGPALSTPVFRRISTAGPDPVSAESALVADLQTGEADYELSPDRRWPIASVTKLFTASFTLRNMDLDRVVTVSEADAAKNGGDFENGLKAGESYRVSDLWKALLIFSSNEAAEALANEYGRAAVLLRRCQGRVYERFRRQSGFRVPDGPPAGGGRRAGGRGPLRGIGAALGLVQGHSRTNAMTAAPLFF